MLKQLLKITALLSLYSFTILTQTNLKTEWIKNLKGDFTFARKHTLKSDAWCYEYAGISEITVKKLNKDSIECFTLPNSATHSTLHFYIIKGKLKQPKIELNSIADGKKTYFCNDGFLKIDSKAINKGILKAEFNMTFDHPENPKVIMFWNGKIYSKIK